MLALSQPSAERANPRADLELGARVDELIDLLLRQDVAFASQYINELRSDGVPLTDIYLDLLAPCARRLGEMWERDEKTFTDVTVGVCHMHQVMLEFTRCFDPVLGAEVKGRSALILPTLGEQHTFGLFLLMEFMRSSRLELLQWHSKDQTGFQSACRCAGLQRHRAVDQRLIDTSIPRSRSRTGSATDLATVTRCCWSVGGRFRTIRT